MRRLYEAADPALAASLNDALEARAIAGDAERAAHGRPRRLSVAPLASAAARFLASADGPRIAVLDVGGWDTHANQGAAQGPLALRLRGLDDGLQMLKTGARRALAARRRVLVVTEFGRTVAVNGTRGTDHGTAGCAFLAGGAVAAAACSAIGRGSRRATCTRGATCAPTTDLRALFKAVLHERFGLGEAALARTVFPASDAVAPLDGLTA